MSIETEIFNQRQEKLNEIRTYYVHELLGLVPQAFISQVEDIDRRIDQQLEELRKNGYLLGKISYPEDLS